MAMVARSSEQGVLQPGAVPRLTQPPPPTIPIDTLPARRCDGKLSLVAAQAVQKPPSKNCTFLCGRAYNDVEVDPVSGEGPVRWPYKDGGGADCCLGALASGGAGLPFAFGRADEGLGLARAGAGVSARQPRRTACDAVSSGETASSV